MKKSREFLCSAGKNQGSFIVIAGKNQGSFCVLREKIKGVFEIIMCQNLHNRQQNHSKKKAKLITCIFLNKTPYYKNSILKK